MKESLNTSKKNNEKLYSVIENSANGDFSNETSYNRTSTKKDISNIGKLLLSISFYLTYLRSISPTFPGCGCDLTCVIQKFHKSILTHF